MVETSIKRQSIKKNYILNTALQLVLIIVPLITIPYVSRVLGVERVGDYSYAGAMVAYFSLFAVIGSGTYGQRQIAYVRDDREKRNSVFWNVFSFRVITTSVSLLSYFIYLFLSKNINAICILFSLNIVNVMFDLTWFYQGLEDFKQIVLKNVLAKLASLALIFAFVKSNNDLWIYTLIMCFSTVTGSLLTWVPIRKYITKPKARIRPFFAVKEMVMIFLPTIAVQVYTVLDKSMIGWFTNSSYANGCYDRAESIVRLGLTVVTSVSAVILPRVANLFKNKDIEKAKKYIYKAYRFVFFLSIPITIGFISISSVFIHVFLGDGYEDAVVLLRIFSPLVIIVSLANVTGFSFLVATKQQNVYTIAVSISAIVNLVLNLILIPKYSALGAAISSIIAEFLGCSIQICYCVFKKQLSAKKIFFPCLKYVVSGALMFKFLYMLSEIPMGNFKYLCVMVLGGSVFYFILLFALRDSLVMSESKRIIIAITKFFNSRRK